MGRVLMGLLMALGLFLLGLRVLATSGLSPRWSVGLSLLGVVFLYPILVQILSDFWQAVTTPPWLILAVLAILLVLALAGLGGYVFGRRDGAGGSPFRFF